MYRLCIGESGEVHVYIHVDQVFTEHLVRGQTGGENKLLYPSVHIPCTQVITPHNGLDVQP